MLKNYFHYFPFQSLCGFFFLIELRLMSLICSECNEFSIWEDLAGVEVYYFKSKVRYVRVMPAWYFPISVFTYEPSANMTR